MERGSAQKPTLEEIKKLNVSDFEVETQVEEGLVIPEDEELLAEADESIKKELIKRITPKESFKNRIQKEVVNRNRSLKAKRSTIYQRSKVSLSRFLGQINSLRKYQAATITLFLLFSIGFTCIRGAGAATDVNSLTEEAEQNVARAFELIDSGDYAGALKEADSAKLKIQKLKLLAQSWGQDVTYLSIIPENRSRLVAYESFLDSAYTILNTFGDLKTDLAKSSDGDSFVTYREGAELPGVDIIALNKILSSSVQEASKRLKTSRDKLSNTKDNLPSSVQMQSNKAIVAIDKALATIDSTKIIVNDGLPWLSGANGSEKNILFLFQNNTELRASGGFLGSFALVKFKDGKLENINFETNIYKIDKAFSAENKIPVPEEFSYSTLSWCLRDANYAIDFPESMAKVKEFFTKETNERVDGVVALDTTLFTELLKVTGPINMPKYGKEIGSDNFLKDVQYEVEKGYFQRPGGVDENEPKRILSDMMPIFLNKLIEASKDEEKMPQILAILGSAVKEKHLLFNVNDPSLQKTIEALGFAGQVDHELSDYLFVNNTNIQGKKSSLNVRESLKHKVNIGGDGKISSSLNITRQHSGTGEWPDGININLIRVLLPENSTAVSFSPKSGNFWPNNEEKNKKPNDYYMGEEAGKTKASFWQNTKPGETSESYLEYRPNYRVNTTSNEFTYNLKVQKQPGTLNDDYVLEVTYPVGFKPVNVKNYDHINRMIVIKDQINADKEYSLIFEKVTQ